MSEIHYADQRAYEEYIKTRPASMTENDDFNAGWNAAIKFAAELVHDFQDSRTFARAQDVLLDAI